MKGVRLPDGTPPRAPGEYAYMPYSMWELGPPPTFIGEGEWHAISPDGGIGAFGRDEKEKPAAHTITVHEDGSITASPSLVFPNDGWHGFLTRGEFS